MSVLDTVLPTSIPYPIRGGIIRAVRTGVAILLAAVAASLTDGSIISQVDFIPTEYKPAIILGLSTAFAGVDKWLRERDLVGDVPEEDADVPTSGPTEPITGDVPAEEPITDGVNPDTFDDPKDDV